LLLYLPPAAEPNKDMRKQAQIQLAGFERKMLVNGLGEQIFYRYCSSFQGFSRGIFTTERFMWGTKPYCTWNLYSVKPANAISEKASGQTYPDAFSLNFLSSRPFFPYS
jgi:hypothetical protein